MTLSHLNPKKQLFIKPIVFIGMMGVGKTTVGKLVADRLRTTFSDSDCEITQTMNLSIPDIFKNYGETKFREIEFTTLANLLSRPPHIIASGGGAFIQKNTREMLLKHAITIWLDADIERLVKNTVQSQTRPLLQTPNPRESLIHLKNTRDPIYKTSLIHINTKQHTLSNIVAHVLTHLKPYMIKT